MLTTNPFDDDKLREECGIFGIWGADSASSFVALGLHALQHRGQEAAGIVTFDGTNYHAHRAMGHVAGNFDRDESSASCRAPSPSAMSAIRPPARRRSATSSRCSPTSPKAALGRPQWQPLQRHDPARGLIRRGSIFQSTSDTEVIIHLVATSSYSTPLDRLTDALSQARALLAGLPDSRRPGRLPRPARHPPAGHGQARRSNHLRLRNRRARRDRRDLFPRC